MSTPTPRTDVCPGCGALVAYFGAHDGIPSFRCGSLGENRSPHCKLREKCVQLERELSDAKAELAAFQDPDKLHLHVLKTCTREQHIHIGGDAMQKAVSEANARAESWKADAIKLDELVSQHNHNYLCPRFWNLATGVCDCGLSDALAAHAKLMEGER